MTHDELLVSIERMTNHDAIFMKDALLAVVKLHKPVIHALPDETCWACQDLYPCPTIQAIEGALK